MPEQIPYFQTKEDAIDWMEQEVDDPYIDNHRFAFKDDENETTVYENLKAYGCCGFFDAEVVCDGKPAMIGCNYGH